MFEPYSCNTNHQFINPTDVFRADGTCKYAYVSLLMMGDSYLPGLMTLVYSIKKMGSLIDIIIMVTDDVSQHARDMLGKLGAQTIIVPYIEPIKGIVMESLVHRYPHYAKTFTKINMLTLTQYEKVLFLDGDNLVFKHFDSLFTLKPPAAIYYGSNRMHENNYKPRLKGDHYMWHTRYCNCCDHGKLIPTERTDVVKHRFDKGGIIYGMSTECMLMKPDIDKYNEIILELHNKNFVAKYPNGFLSDTGYLTWKFSGKWTGIDPRFLGRRGYPRIEDVFGITMGGSKPWNYENIKLVSSYPDFAVWYEYFFDMLEEYNFQDPSLIDLKNKALQYMSKDKYLSINIILSTDSSCLNNDAKIFEHYMSKFLKKSVFKTIKPGTTAAHTKTDSINSDVNIFLGDINGDFVKLIFASKYNILVVNHEYFDYPGQKNLINNARLQLKGQSQYNLNNDIDLYLCRTLEDEKFVKQIADQLGENLRTVYTKFTNIFPLKQVDKNFGTFLYDARDSDLEGINTVVNTWMNNPSLPRMIVICYRLCNNNLKEHADYKNIELHNEDNEDNDNDEIVNLKNRIGFHLCPSHYLNEARITSSVILTLDEPPMNELVDNDSGILIPSTSKVVRDNGSLMYMADETQLLEGVGRMLKLSEKEREQLRHNARYRYEADTLYFNNRMKKLCEYLMQRTLNQKVNTTAINFNH